MSETERESRNMYNEIIRNTTPVLPKFSINSKSKELSSSTTEPKNNKRDRWASKWEYLLSLAGVAIGLGNVWRFPYMCYKNGGGVFLIPYFLMTGIVGLPLFFLESSLGQFSSSGCISLYEACPAFKGVGYTSVIITLIASTFYSVVISYPLVFLYHSFSSVLPWSTCDNIWNTPNCHTLSVQEQVSYNSTLFLEAAESINSPADEFFHYEILQISSGITQVGNFVPSIVGAMCFVWIFVFLCIFRGVKIVGKVVWFTTTFPFVVMISLLIRGLTLPGAYEGIVYFIYPDFSKLLQYQVWCDAATQVFFSLQVGWGSVIAMGSFNGYKSDSLKDVLWIPILNAFASILAGFVIFSILGFMAVSKGVSINEVVAAGPSLAFITYPEALSMMPGAAFWSVAFFLMLFMLGIGSCFVQIQTMVASISDEFPALRNKKMTMSFFVCLFSVALSLPCCTQGGIYVLTLLDSYSVAIPVSVACLTEVIVFAYCYGGGALIQDIQLMTSKTLSRFWWFCWMFFTPVALIAIVANNIINIVHSENSYKDYVFPSWTKCVAWALAFFPVLFIPLVWFITMFGKNGSFNERLFSIHNPSKNWGPKSSEEKLIWTQNSCRKSLKNKFFHPSASAIFSSSGSLTTAETMNCEFAFPMQDKY